MRLLLFEPQRRPVPELAPARSPSRQQPPRERSMFFATLASGYSAINGRRRRAASQTVSSVSTWPRYSNECPRRRWAAVAIQTPSFRSASVRVWLTMNRGRNAPDLVLQPLRRPAVSRAVR